jgi:hypothetical protein
LNPETIIHELKKNIFRNFVFYIPSSLLNKDMTTNPEINYLIDKVIFLDYNLMNSLPNEINGENYIIDEDLTIKNVLTKMEFYDKNIRMLLKEKVNMPKHEYKYILHKYLDFINKGILWGKSQSDLIKVLVKPTPSDKIIQAFNIQRQFLIDHHKDLELNFKIKKTDKTIKNTYLISFIMDLYSINSINDTSNSNIIEKTELNINDELTNSDKSDNSFNEPQKTIADYITHPKSKQIEKIITENFKTEKGLSIRCIIEYLNYLNIMPFEYGKKITIYKSLKNTFQRDIGPYSTIWTGKIDRLQDKSYLSIKKTLQKLLEDILKT